MRKLLLISFALNTALVLAVGYGLKQRQTPPVVATATTSTSEKIKAENPAAKNVRSTPPRVGEAENKSIAAEKISFDWREVESPDYKVYIENLRRVHCPQSTIADIIIADVNKFYRNKLAPFRKDNEDTFKFWETDNFWPRTDPAYEKAARDIEKEKGKLLKDLLGQAYEDEAKKYSPWQMDSANPLQKISDNAKERVAEIAEKFSEMRNEIYRKRRGGMWDEDDQEELRKIEKKQTAELAKILSPEELLDFRLRSSETVQNMRWNELEGFEVSEDEFRAIAKARLEAEDLEGGSGKKLTREERTRLAKESEENIKKLLGEDRFAELKLNQEWDYRNLRKIVEKNGGDKEIARQVFGMKDEIQRAVSTVRADKALTKEERNQKMIAIREEVEGTLTEVLGERGYKAFKRNAWWLRNMMPEAFQQN